MRKKLFFLVLTFTAHTMLPKGQFFMRLKQLRNTAPIILIKTSLEKIVKNLNKPAFQVPSSSQPILMSQHEPQLYIKDQKSECEKACAIYDEEVLYEIQNHKESKVSCFDFEGKVTQKIKNETIKNLKQEFSKNGIPIDQATKNDVKSVLRKIGIDPEVATIMNELKKITKGKDLYQKFIDCIQQPNSKICKQENKNLIEAITADLYKKYYETNKGNIIAFKNYTTKKTPIKYSLASICFFRPKIPEKNDTESQTNHNSGLN